ncbi:hypothetical protein METBIDRAFT_78189 [Metschnikowia bicuspidata var. bicuspidata NRRL YB-4993]|uniref:Conserved oligomeric Golgi complex subunit 2 n=1 Tax=Metschnikowia bicuspidata var. bicuspidata NRRL YB-4993 TaxID=869754 RepID=A0A1A0HB79_9ASCO|nr:hypothetical protein METBIDRAFT_78189 [Metschnikowia bicuspidata var. bicuspidata NRRL YB-4993]OBA21132.1 hypothetical protein METBIDRAFT_78189 [Metschnikowia bicuspidata var. bicuspidata NRRL YB-4993]
MDFDDRPGPEEPFPYPLNITREDFADVALFDPDEFLFKNHRYTSLDSLIADLRSLSKSLNQDLLDLVNNEYTNFIELGQSIGSCLELIDNLSVEVCKFKASLGQTFVDFSESSATAKAILQHKRSLNLLKNKIKVILLLHEQCISFETLLALDVADLSPGRLDMKLHTLTTLHLSIGKMYALIIESNLANTETCQFFDNVVKTKVLTLKFEFKLYLDELLVMARSRSQEYRNLILSILQTYRILGMSSEAVQTLRNKV